MMASTSLLRPSCLSGCGRKDMIGYGRRCWVDGVVVPAPPMGLQSSLSGYGRRDMVDIGRLWSLHVAAARWVVWYGVVVLAPPMGSRSTLLWSGKAVQHTKAARTPWVKDTLRCVPSTPI